MIAILIKCLINLCIRSSPPATRNEKKFTNFHVYKILNTNAMVRLLFSFAINYLIKNDEEKVIVFRILS